MGQVVAQVGQALQVAAPIQAAPVQAAPVQAPPVQTLALVRALAPAPRVPTQAQVEPQAQVVEAQLHRDGDVVFRVFGCSIELAVRQFEVSG